MSLLAEWREPPVRQQPDGSRRSATRETDFAVLFGVASASSHLLALRFIVFNRVAKNFCSQNHCHLVFPNEENYHHRHSRILGNGWNQGIPDIHRHDASADAGRADRDEDFAQCRNNFGAKNRGH